MTLCLLCFYMAVSFFWFIFFLICKRHVYKIICIYMHTCVGPYIHEEYGVLLSLYQCSSKLIQQENKEKIIDQCLFCFLEEKLWCTKYIKDNSKRKKKRKKSCLRGSTKDLSLSFRMMFDVFWTPACSDWLSLWKVACHMLCQQYENRQPVNHPSNININ